MRKLPINCYLAPIIRDREFCIKLSRLQNYLYKILTNILLFDKILSNMTLKHKDKTEIKGTIANDTDNDMNFDYHYSCWDVLQRFLYLFAINFSILEMELIFL